ncbi:hypothetical protein ABN097_24380 [Enterobacter cloacae]|uniref:hypothetical protein n=1 Tax=Enterobacter cloacae TaxID=550 RepID=UPI00325B37E3
MMNIRKSLLAVIIAGAGFAGMAQAGTLSGGGATAEADIVFTNPAEVTNTLTATTGLVAGDLLGNVSLAQGVVASLDGSANQYAVRITNGEKNSTYPDAVFISGKNNSENKLGVMVAFVDGVADSNEVIDGKNFRITKNKYTTVDYNINSWDNGKVGAKADTYTVQTEAYIYNV